MSASNVAKLVIIKAIPVSRQEDPVPLPSARPYISTELPASPVRKGVNVVYPVPQRALSEDVSSKETSVQREILPAIDPSLPLQSNATGLPTQPFALYDARRSTQMSNVKPGVSMPGSGHQIGVGEFTGTSQSLILSAVDILSRYGWRPSTICTLSDGAICSICGCEEGVAAMVREYCLKLEMMARMENPFTPVGNSVVWPSL